jgi:geranylgeranyl diphosphate synthase type II
MYYFEEIKNMVQEAIDAENWIDEPAELYEPIKYSLTTGGKRLRPALLLMGLNLYSSDINACLIPALGIEIFHNFTLVHDDIMDNADVRRSFDTVHKKWDINTAILSGDAMFIKAYEYLMKYEGPNSLKIFRFFNQSALKVCEGQQYDMNFETIQQVTAEEYLKMIELKTAELIAGSLKIGALMGNADEQEAELLYRFGINLGMAFQLQDDYLDTFGDEKIFGKNIGGDILADKKTFLLIKAFEKAGNEEKEILDRYIGNKEVDPADKIAQVKDVFSRLGINEITEKKADQYFTDALNRLNDLPKSRNSKDPLMKLSNLMMRREK